jgi:hypothetical protein
MLAMIAGLHSPRRKPQVNAIDQVFGTYRQPVAEPGLDRHPGLGRDRQPRQPPAPPILTAQCRPTTASNPTQHPVGAGRRVTQEPSVPGAEGSLHLGSPPGRWWRLVALPSRCTETVQAGDGDRSK